MEARVIDVLLLLHRFAVDEHSDSVAVGAVVQHFHLLSLVRTHLAGGGASFTKYVVLRWRILRDDLFTSPPSANLPCSGILSKPKQRQQPSREESGPSRASKDTGSLRQDRLITVDHAGWS